MAQVGVTFETLKELYGVALELGTVKHFAPVALQWAEKADDEIVRLRKLVAELEARNG